MHPATAHMPAPELEMKEDTPVSAAFGDVYFSRAGGVAETEHVFLQGSDLPQRWSGRKNFTIGELGFGSGLNFLVAWKRFVETADADATLHFISIEKFPFTREQLQAVLKLQPELAAEAEHLLAMYPLRLPGIHRIHLPRVVLTLCFGDVVELLPQWNTPINAWFLDGFSPAKNPEMWTPEVLSHLTRLSGKGTTLATFTSAGEVRRQLTAAGFTIEKRDGFGHKRDMSVGVFNATESKPCVTSSGQKPIVIIGAGIAGATLARALATRGIAVTVLERGDVASGASGNAAGVLFPQLTKQWNMSTSWYFTAYGFMLRQLRRWEPLTFARAQCGMLRLPCHAEEEAQLRAMQEVIGLDPAIAHWVDREEACAKAGIDISTGGAWFPHGTWLSPAELCHALLQHEAITLRTHVAVTSLTRAGDTWRVTLGEGEVMEAGVMCVAAAQESATLLGEYGMTLNAVGGQISEIAAGDAATIPRSILCHKGYMIPCGNTVLVGATYHRERLTEVTEERHAENIAELQTILPGFSGNIVGGRSAIRATTPDRLPYVGEVVPGLYVSTGHGSRGLLSAPLAAEMIASALCGEQAPVTPDLAHAVRPLRFRKA